MRIDSGKLVGVQVDDEDAWLLSRLYWQIATNGYVIGYANRRRKSQINLLLHRVIVDAPRGREVDHINHDKLDNRRCNLRIVTHRQNSQNRASASSNSKTGIRGVRPRFGRFVATVGGKHIGMYATITEAEAAVIAARAQLMTHSPECELVR